METVPRDFIRRFQRPFKSLVNIPFSDLNNKRVLNAIFTSLWGMRLGRSTKGWPFSTLKSKNSFLRFWIAFPTEKA